jgi:hypothetical protein
MRRAALFVALHAVACAPDFEDQPYLVDRPRLIAVIAEPAELRPREAVTLTPVVVGPGAQNLEASWRFCTAPPRVADPRPIADSCLSESGTSNQTIPADACARFGPDPADGKQRPTDPDSSGGFYQPVVIDGLGEPAVARVRIHCPLPDVAAELSQQLEQRYVLNHNPELLGLESSELRAGVVSRLRVNWSATSAETYAFLPIDGSRIETRRESLRVSWFTTLGKLGASTTDSSENTLLLPSEASHVALWVVLQDSRGGSDAKHFRLEVSP